MTDKPGLHPTASRRTILLQGIACGFASSVGPSTQASAAKMAQAAASYQGSPKNTQECDNCSQFQAPNSCQLVDGTISPLGWCKFYVKKTS
jgi:hypothetical protein